MADIEIHRDHCMGLAAARRAAEQMAADLGRKFDVHGSWQGDTLRFDRPGVSGFVVLTDKDLRLSISLGFLLKAMRASIEKLIHQELDALFPAAAAGAPRATASPRASRAPRAATAKKASKRPKRGG
ncbi:MAG TPA: polyhydroxyalkanoic acid system family protein [Usitatibacter sp.]|nr:polyhydroxyalkanoic acid system family protein [Usitatibacter sp.]